MDFFDEFTDSSNENLIFTDESMEGEPSMETDISEIDESDQELHEDEEKDKRAFEMINKMRNRDLFCDVTLKSKGGTNIRAHQMILASCSPYFYEVFANFDRLDQPCINIPGIQHSTLELLVDYIYTSKILITEKNVQTLIKAADYLQLSDVQDACSEFMQYQMTSYDCLGTLDFAEKNGCKALLSFTKKFVEENFGKIIKNNEFLALSFERISQLISSVRLPVPSEETIFEGIISWVNFDRKGRKKYLAQLIENLQMPLLSQKFLVERVEKEPLFKSNLQCQQFLIEALKYHLLDNNQKILSQTTTTTTNNNLPQSSSKVLLVLGGLSDWNVIHNGECYDFEKKKWFPVSEFRTARRGARLAVVEERIYILGGRYINHIDVYNHFTEKWSKLKGMKTPRMSFGVGVFQNCIYAVGGHNGNVTLNSAEFYNTSKNEWKIIPPMLERRCGHGIGIIDGFIYAVGGFDSIDRKYLSSAEQYDPKHGEWKLIAHMSTPRYGVGIGVINNILYAVGGHDGKSDLRSIEAYNPKTNQWNLLSEMSKCREFPGVVAFDGMLHVVGGFDETSDLTSVEIFSPSTNSWTNLSSCMSVTRRCAGVAIIEKANVPRSFIRD